MRICVLARGVPDGKSPLNGIYEWGLAVTLARSGYEVVVLALDLRTGKKRKKRGLDRFVREGVEVWDYGLPVGRIGKKASSALRFSVAARAYAAMAREGRLPDLTWAFFCRTFGKVAERLEKEFGVPFALSEYEGRLLTEKLPVSEINRMSRIYAKAVAATAPNEAFRGRLENIFGTEFVFLPQTITAASERMEHEGFVFLSIGALCVEKGMDVLIRAFSKVKKTRRDVKLVIVGKGDERRALGEQAEALGVKDSVAFLSPSKGRGLNRYLSEGDCFVLASRKELFGTVYIAALSAGIPVITTKCFSPEGLIPPEAGKIVPVDDASELAEAMEEACSEDSPYRSEKIKAYAEENFSVAAAARKIAEILKKRKENFPAPDIT